MSSASNLHKQLLLDCSVFLLRYLHHREARRYCFLRDARGRARPRASGPRRRLHARRNLSPCLFSRPLSHNVYSLLEWWVNHYAMRIHIVMVYGHYTEHLKLMHAACLRGRPCNRSR